MTVTRDDLRDILNRLYEAKVVRDKMDLRRNASEKRRPEYVAAYCGAAIAGATAMIHRLLATRDFGHYSPLREQLDVLGTVADEILAESAAMPH